MGALRAYVLTDEEIDHSETLLWSRVQGQRVELVAPDRCVHGVQLKNTCGPCYEEEPSSRLVRVLV